MADVFTKAKRSEVMSRIRSRGNRDMELALARLLRANGISGWRRHFQIRGRAVLPRGQKNQAAQQRRPTKNQRTARPFVAKAMQGRRSVPTFWEHELQRPRGETSNIQHSTSNSESRAKE